MSFLLLGGGALEAEYRAVAPTTLFAGTDELARHAAALAANGFRAAIVNTSTAGRAGVAAARQVVFAAGFVRDRYHDVVALTSERTVVLPQGLYRPVERDGAAGAPAVAGGGDAGGGAGLCGSAYLRKGFDLFLQVWRLAQAADASIHLLWVGDLDPVVSAYLGAEIAAADAIAAQILG